MDRPTSTASPSVSAPTTSMRMSLLAPSASPISWRARSSQTVRTASAKASYAGTWPEAPEASSSTVSLVDMQPSESTRSKVVRVAERSALSRVPLSRSASVVRTTSMVARPGASMPAPLAMPPTVQPSWAVTVAVLCTVSVVLMAMAAASPPSSDSAATAVSMPGSSLSMGSRTPIRPVDATATSPALCSPPSACATFSAVAWVSWKPLGPVQALAPPELRTTALTEAPRMTCSDQSTGAALTRLEVKTPAAASRGPWLTTRARSGLPFALIPAAMPAAVNPCAAVTVTARLRSWKARVLRGARGRCSCSVPRRRRCPW